MAGDVLLGGVVGVGGMIFDGGGPLQKGGGSAGGSFWFDGAEVSGFNRRHEENCECVAGRGGGDCGGVRGVCDCQGAGADYSDSTCEPDAEGGREGDVRRPGAGDLRWAAGGRLHSDHGYSW